MKTTKYIAAISVPLFALLLGGSGCSSEDAKDAACGTELKARVDALDASVETMVNAAGELRVSVATACANIANAGGQTVSVPTDPTDKDVKAACDAAQLAINAKLKVAAAGTVKLVIKPAECRVDASAQLSCEGKCQADVSCTEPDIKVRCEGGTVSVKCAGSCTGQASCEGSATVKANCEGTCGATCEGTCSGTCTGKCEGTCSAKSTDGTTCNGTCTGKCTGSCSASCKGTCTGKCDMAANANVQCNAEARCEGTCSVQGTEPKCEGTIKPPTCEGNAECQASCDGNAKFEAECTPPSVKLAFSGTVDAAFVAVLETNLSVLVDIKAKGELIVDAAADIASNFSAVISSSAQCAVALAAEIKAAAEASVSISASVSVSASASGSVSSS